LTARGALGGQVRRSLGFSLVELIVTVSVRAMLKLNAVQCFQWLLNTNRLTAPANEMVASLQVARIESIRRNSRVVVCRSNNPGAGGAAACTSSTASWPGWIVFVDNGDNGTGTIVAANARNGQRDAGETLIRTGTVVAPLQMLASTSVTNQNSSVIFRSEGLARATAAGPALSGMISVCLPTRQPVMNVREVRVVAGSRVSVSRIDDGGLCRAPPNTR